MLRWLKDKTQDQPAGRPPSEAKSVPKVLDADRTGAKRYGDDIEPAISLGKLGVRSEIRRSGTGDLRLFSDGHRLGRRAVGRAASGLDLDEDERAAVVHHQIEFRRPAGQLLPDALASSDAPASAR